MSAFGEIISASSNVYAVTINDPPGIDPQDFIEFDEDLLDTDIEIVTPRLRCRTLVYKCVMNPRL